VAGWCDSRGWEIIDGFRRSFEKEMSHDPCFNIYFWLKQFIHTKSSLKDKKIIIKRFSNVEKATHIDMPLTIAYKRTQSQRSANLFPLFLVISENCSTLATLQGSSIF